MSILEAFEPGAEPIITPEKFYKRAKKSFYVAVVCFSYKVRDYVLSAYEHELYYRFAATANGPLDLYFLPQYNVLFFMSPIGSALAGQTLQEVAFIASVRQFIYFGSCGILDASLRGKYIVPTSCYREEGFSYHYAPPSDFIEMENSDYVFSFFHQQSRPFIKGKGWTTDSIYNETRKKLAQRKAEGVVCVDMEAAGLQAVANHIGVDLYLFFFSGDILDDSWERGDLGGDKEAIHQTNAAQLALGLAASLFKNDVHHR